MIRMFSVVIVLLSLLPGQVLAQAYKVDPSHTVIEFKVKNLLVTNVRGTFDKFRGTVFIDDKDLRNSKVDVSIDAASISTGIGMRDNHLRTADFFDVAKYPVITFVSTAIEPGPGTLKVTGNLTIKGTTKQVTLLVDGPKSLPGDVKRGASASAAVNRQDFGLGYGMTIGDEVLITVTTDLIKQ